MFAENKKLRIELNRGILYSSDSMTARKGFDQIIKHQCIKRDYALWIEYKCLYLRTYVLITRKYTYLDVCNSVLTATKICSLFKKYNNCNSFVGRCTYCTKNTGSDVTTQIGQRVL
jgi:hypothetical protein